MRADGVAVYGSADEGDAWQGTVRYRIVRCIGRGGMGVVYEAMDRDQGRLVALKTLPRFDPDGLYRFKQEFRTLVDVSHVNLVRLYELVASDPKRIFFTMELVPGVDFARYVRTAGAPASVPSSAVITSTNGTPPRAGARPAASDHPAEPESTGRTSPADVERLRRAARQLVQGVHALHSAGKVHRDLKPSNVLVTSEGRVVILDFGVATELSRGERRGAGDAGEIVGTACYMSPEQASDHAAPGPASDWYSVGVMLYEALVGRPPFVGSAVDVVARKVALDPIPAAACTDGIPPDLDALCSALLQRDPRQRPSGPEILRALGASTGSVPPPSFPVDASVGLVGREAQMQGLRDAIDACRAGRPVAVRVEGDPGLGKSTVVHHVLDEMEARGDALVLRGRAYEREAVPYKAVDAVVDALARHLVRAAEAGTPVALPDDSGPLLQLFPVLQQVRAPSASSPPVEDAQGVRRRAFGAVRELVQRLARTAPVVVFIDDAHWGDVDSAQLLLEVLRPPAPPPVLLVMTYRDREAETSPFLGELAARWPEGVEARSIAVGPLEPADAERLALAFIGDPDEGARRAAQAIAREAHGSPFVVEELSRAYRTDRHEGGTPTPPTLEQLIGQRLDRFPEKVRALVELVAVGGRPLPLPVLAAASGLEGSLERTVASLCARRLTRSGFRDGGDVVEIAHDCIREAVVGMLSAEVLRRHHGRLAAALEADPGADLEALAAHMLGSGDTERGARCAEKAGEQAASKLAFDQAARLFGWALEARGGTDADAQRLRLRRAQMLEGAGRASDAADAYGDAAKRATGIERLDLERASAEQLLVCGRVDEGEAAFRRVLGVMGMSAPRTSLGAVLTLLFYQAWGALVTLWFREREPDEVSPEDRVRVDALHSVSIGLGVVDAIVGACMQARHMVLAMQVGDRQQVLRAMCIELRHLASTGNSFGRRGRRLAEAARGLSERSGPRFVSRLATTDAIALYMRGQYRDGLSALDAAAALSRKVADARSPHVPLFAMYCCFFTGKLREQARRAQDLLRDAEDRGDVYTAVSIRSTVMVDVCLAADDLESARLHAREAMARWTRSGFHVQHWYAMWSEVKIALYEGDGAAARARFERDAKALRRSFLLRARLIRGYTSYMQGCMATAGAGGASGAAQLAEARRCARSLHREGQPWSETLAWLVDAAASNGSGDRAGAAAALRGAIASVEASGMQLHAWAARHQLGLLLGGDEGAALVDGAVAAMKGEGIRAPDRLAASIVPGRWSPA